MSNHTTTKWCRRAQTSSSFKHCSRSTFPSLFAISILGESIFIVAYIINRLPTPVLSKASPYEKLHNSTPTYHHMKVFGCLRYAITITPSHKFDIRARKYIFVGYPLGQKAYCLFDLSTHTFFFSRNVTFHESIFPFSAQLQDTHFDQPDPYTSSLPLPAPIYPQTLSIHSSLLGEQSTLPLLPPSNDVIISSPTPSPSPNHVLPPSLTSLSHPYHQMFPHLLLFHAEVLEPTTAPPTSKIITASMPPCFPLACHVLVQGAYIICTGCL